MKGDQRDLIMMAAMEGDLPRLLALGRDGLGRPLLLGSDTLSVLGWSGPPAMAQDAPWEDFIAAGLAPDFQWSEELFQTNSLELEHGFSACLVARADGGADWLVDIEMNGGQPVHLILSGKDRPELPPPEGALLGLVCLAVRACLNNRAGLQPSHLYSPEQLLLQLIRTAQVDEPLLRFRAQAARVDSEGYFSLLMVDLKGYHPQRSSVATIRSLLAAAVDGPSVIDGEVLTFLIGHDSGGPEEDWPVWRRVEPLLQEHGLFAAFTPVFYRLGEFHRLYAYGLNALRLRFCAPTGRALIACGELALYCVVDDLRQRDDPVLTPHPILRTLLRSDQERKTAYVDTLDAYLAHAQKAVATCAALHIHRNTLDYRLRRIEALTGLDWEDGDLLFRLYFSLRALRYDRLARAAEPRY